MNKILKYTSLTCLILFCTHALAQEFHKNLVFSGSHYIYSMTQLPDSGYVMAGEMGNDLFITRTDKNGGNTWAKKIPIASLSEEFHKVIFTSNKRIVAVGYGQTSTSPVNPRYLYVYQFDLAGNILNRKRITYNTTGAYGDVSLVESPSKDIYISVLNHVVRLDSTCNLEWRKSINVSALELRSVHVLSHNRILLTGICNNLIAWNSSRDVIQLRMDTSGTLLSKTVLGTEAVERTYPSVYTPDKKVFHIGSHSDSLFVLCTDTTGNQLWCKTYKQRVGNLEEIITIQADSSVLLITTTTTSPSTPEIIRLSKTGEVLSIFKINPSHNLTRPHVMCPTYGNGYLLKSNSSFTSAWTILNKVSADLTPNCLTYTHSSVKFTPAVFTTEEDFVTTVTSSTATATPTNTTTNITYTNSVLCTNTCGVSASVSAHEVNVCPGSTIHFINNSTGATSFSWYVNGALSSSTTGFSHLFTSAGSYKLKLVASNGICTDSSVIYIHVTAPVTMPDFSYTPTDMEVSFDPGNDPYDHLLWTFGDGSGHYTSFGNISHAYHQPGTYEVCMSRSNACNTDSVCKSIDLSPSASYNFLRYYEENGLYSGDQWPSGVLQTSDGGFIVYGQDDSYNSTFGSLWSGIFFKTQPDGTVIKTKIADMSSDAYITQSIECYNGDIVVAGRYGNFITYGRLDSALNMNYFFNLSVASTEFPANPIELNDGSLILAGARNSDGFVMKTTQAGSLTWYKRYSCLRNIKVIRSLSDGGFILTGNDSTNFNIGVVKIDQNGNLIWAKSYDMGPSSEVFDMVVSANGTYYFTGGIYNTPIVEAFIMHTDSTGNLLWAKSYVQDFVWQRSIGRSITEDSKGNLYVTAPYYQVSNGNGENLLFKTTATGTVLWASSPVASLNKHCKTYDDGIAVAGVRYNSSGPEYGIALMKLDSTGLPTCAGPLVSTITTNRIPTITSLFNFSSAILPTLTNDVIYVVNYNQVDWVACMDVTYPNGQPDFTAPDSACTNLPVPFNNQSEGAILSYHWTFESGTPATSNLVHPQATWNTPGEYLVTLTTITTVDTVSHTDTIVVIAPPGIDAGMDLFMCKGDTINLSGSGSGNLQWQAVSSLQHVLDMNSPVYPAFNTDYILQASNNTCTVYDTVAVTVHQPAFSAGSDLSICLGDSASTNASGTATSFSWSPGTGVSDPTLLNPLVFPDLTTTYILTGTYGPGCQHRDTITVTVYQNTAVPLADKFICAGDTTAVTAAPSLSCTWAPAAGIDNVNACAPVFDPVTTTTYFLTFTDLHSCTQHDTVVIHVTALPNVNAGTDSTICDGDTIQLSGSGSGLLHWVPSSSLGNAFDPNTDAFPTVHTSYVLIAEDNGCTNSDTLAVMIHHTVFSAGTDLSVCLGDSVTSNASGTATSFSWSPVTGLSDPSVLNPSFFPGVSSTYVLTVTDGPACQYSDTLQVTVFENTAAPLTDAFLCAGDSTTLTTAPSISCTWIPSTGIDHVNACDPVFYPTTTTTYFLTFTDFNSCTQHDTVSIHVTNLPTVHAGIDSIICYGDTIQLLGSGTGSLHWSPSSFLGNVFDPNTTAFPTANTTYVLIAENSGCTNSDTVNILVAVPSFDLNDDQTICQGDTVMINPTGTGSAFTWSPATGLNDPTSFTPYAYPLSTTTYYLTGNYGGTCTLTDSCVITVINPPPTPFITLLGDSLTAPFGAYNYTWLQDGIPIPGANTDVYVFSSSGSYSVVLSNSCFSDTSAVVNVIITANPEINNQTFELFPNPTSGKSLLRLNGFIHPSGFHTVNSMGETLSIPITKTADNEYLLDFTNVSNGIYLFGFTENSIPFGLKILVTH